MITTYVADFQLKIAVTHYIKRTMNCILLHLVPLHLEENQKHELSSNKLHLNMHFMASLMRCIDCGFSK